MTFNIGVIIGPILGGLLSDPAGSYADIFGKVQFFLDFPYATPNLLSAFFLFSALLACWLCLDEVSLLLSMKLQEIYLTMSTDVRLQARQTRYWP